MARRKSKKRTNPKSSSTTTFPTTAPATAPAMSVTQSSAHKEATAMEMTTQSTPTTTATEAAAERPRTTVSTLDLAAAVTKGLNERHEILQTKATAELVREVFEQVRQQIETTEGGVINIRGLGVFNCRTVTREPAEGGEPLQVKKIVFKVAKGPK